ncbi:MAG: hypothetical protein II859_06630, partial [Bacteroidales bacterium]|nr:hypothetical protein [Bacteroidales bacterium]
FGKEHLRQRPVYIFCLFCHAAKVHKKHLPDSYDTVSPSHGHFPLPPIIFKDSKARHQILPFLSDTTK